MDSFKSIEEIEKYIQDTDSTINHYLEQLNWTKEHLIKSQDLVECEQDKDHLIPNEKQFGHFNKCRLKKQGYSEKDIDKAYSSDYFYNNSTVVLPLRLPSDTVINILKSEPGWKEIKSEDDIPKTVDRYLSDLSPMQRLKLYEFCIETAKATANLQQVAEDELLLLSEDPRKRKNTDRHKSRLELLAEERDMKRRRQTYKGKKVHSGKKSHLEVLREVISNQMEILQEMAGESECVQSEGHARQRDESQRRSRSSSNYRTNIHHSRSHDHQPTDNAKEERTRYHSKKYRHRSRSMSRKRSSSKTTSHSRQRSRSKTRKRSNSKSGKKSRSKSRERSRTDSKKVKHRSRSRSRKEKKSKHKRSRSRERSRV